MSGEDKNREAIKLIVSVSATMAGISIAVASIIFVIFYQLRSRGELDIAGMWLKIMRWAMYSFFFFAFSVGAGITYMMTSKKAERTSLSILYKRLTVVAFIIGWAMLFFIVYIVWSGAKVVSEIIGT